MHPEAPTPGNFKEWMQNSARPIAVDLFSGAGGLSYGLECAGFRVALAADLDGWALETHAHNFEGLALQLDLGVQEVRDSTVKLFEGVDVAIVVGGPPCQPYSRAGRSKIRSLVESGARDPEDLRRELWRAFIDIVVRIRPRAVLMENVPDMALADDMFVLRQILGHLEGAGYEADARVVDTWHYGVPQHRQRLAVVGIRDGKSFEWPNPSERTVLQDAIGDLPVLDPTGEVVGTAAQAYEGPKSDFQRWARKHCHGEDEHVVYDHVTRAVRPDDLEAFQLLKPGSSYSDLPERLRRYRSDIFDDKYNRLDWKDLSRSITAHIAKDGYWYIHPSQHRTLTVREAARVQTFPDHFRFAGSRSHQFTQIGNAVPPMVGERLGLALLEAIGSEPVRPGSRVSTRREGVRKQLLAWAKTDRSEAPWSYPADAWTILVGLLLAARSESGWPDVRDLLDLIPTFDHATPQMMAALETMSDSGSRRSAVAALSKVVIALRRDSEGWEGDHWRKIAKLSSLASKWMDVPAFGGTGVVPSPNVLRVTARLTGSDVDRQNRLSTGRMELAKVVGDGLDAATVNAAMHRLAAEKCHANAPSCSTCPLRKLCRSAQS